jgi:polyphosphate kinase
MTTIPETSAARYLNRELSWLDFNQRVLAQASDARIPLLERLKFLAISASNLDEFFMVRVGGLLIQAEQAPDSIDIVGWSPSEQLQAIRQRVQSMVDEQYRWLHTIFEELAEHGIRRLDPQDLNSQQLAHLKHIFDEEISSVVSPIAVDDVYNFPAMIGATIGLCVWLQGDVLKGDIDVNGERTGEPHRRFAVLPVRRGLDRILTVPSEQGVHFVLLDDLLAMFADRFFPGQEVLETTPFRTMRNADVTVDERAEDLLAGMQTMLLERRTSDCVRLELAATASPESTAFLKTCLEVTDDLIYRVPGAVDLAALMSLCFVPGYRDLKFEPWPARHSPDFPAGENVFDVMAARDCVLFHPYQDYDPVVDFVVSAASDPQVIAIKQTLYRTSRDSVIVNALRKAAEAGKHVTVILELRARFDEQRNIEWARKLEEAGVDVVFGVRGLKTHAKICLVVRKESAGIRRYIHFGTGNYNESTAKLYSDISLMTCNPELGFDSVNLFNAVTGLSIPQPMNQLVAAPIELRSKFMEMIDVEIANAKQGLPAGIQAKFNSLVDRRMVDRLYEASQAGVPIELNVRGICCLRPGIPGLSENIRVVSIIDRFLEHARIFRFQRGGDPRIYIASADWMVRNLDRRIELMVPVLDPDCAALVTRFLKSCLDDNVSSWELQPDGNYLRQHPAAEETPQRCQEQHYQMARELQEELESTASLAFHPHRA